MNVKRVSHSDLEFFFLLRLSLHQLVQNFNSVVSPSYMMNKCEQVINNQLPFPSRDIFVKSKLFKRSNSFCNSENELVYKLERITKENANLKFLDESLFWLSAAILGRRITARNGIDKRHLPSSSQLQQFHFVDNHRAT